MRIRLVLIVCFAFSSLLGQGIEKQYLLHGVDDSLCYSVSVIEDLENDVAIFSVNENVTKIFGVRGIEEITVHSAKFLEVRFVIRGGSNVKLRRNVLLCVSKGEVYKTLDILSEATSRVTEVYDKAADSLKLFDEKEDYNVTISIKQKGNRYKAVLLERKKVESKYDPSQNESFEKSYELDFDPGGYFFYNSTKRLNKRYKIYSSQNNNTVEKFISEEVPCIQLYKNVYLFIDNKWCLDNGNDSLSFQ